MFTFLEFSGVVSWYCAWVRVRVGVCVNQYTAVESRFIMSL